MMDVNAQNSTPEAPVMSKEFAREIKAITDPLTKQLELLCDLMRHL